MKLPGKTKLIGGFISAIIIGAIGSGVWQYIMEPVLSLGSKAVLELATLGVESFKNDLYREIAKGFHEKASNALYTQFNLLYGFALIAIPVFLALETKKLVGRKSALAEQLQQIESGQEKTPNVAELREELLNIRPERSLKFIYVLIVVGLVVLSAHFVVSMRDSYVVSAVTHFFQLKRIISPYVDLKEMNELESRFAQVQSANDYKIVISKMREIAIQSSIKTPEFEIWQ